MILYCDKCERETWNDKGKCEHCARIEKEEHIKWFTNLSLSDKLDIIYQKLLQ